MAAAQLSVLLFALISNIHGEELIIIRTETGSHTFSLTEDADFCLISRFAGEEKLVLWNMSDLWSKNSTVPEDLKERLSAVCRDEISSCMIHNLTHSDSGQYQEECWTEGKVTHEKNISIIICSTMSEIKSIPVRLGGGADLPCEGAADNLDIQWLKRDFRYKTDVWTRVSEDSTTAVTDRDRGIFQVVKTTSMLPVSNFTIRVHTLYMCVVMSQQQCVSSQPALLFILPVMIYRSVDEAAVLPCTVTDAGDDQPPLWSKFVSGTKSFTELGRNDSLLFPSLTLNHSGAYFCETFANVQTYLLLVCPPFGPPVVELFSEGDELTIRCRDSGEGMTHFWFIKSDQTEGRILSVFPGVSDPSLSRVSKDADANLIISNVSLEHTGEYWCALIDPDQLCVSTTKSLLKLREPFGIDSTIYTVRSSLLSGLLVVLCAAVVAVIQRTRREAETEYANVTHH